VAGVCRGEGVVPVGCYPILKRRKRRLCGPEDLRQNPKTTKKSNQGSSKGVVRIELKDSLDKGIVFVVRGGGGKRKQYDVGLRMRGRGQREGRGGLGGLVWGEAGGGCGVGVGVWGGGGI